MKQFLILGSILCTLCMNPCMAQDTDSLTQRKYELLMNVRGREMTGLCVMKPGPNNSIVGTTFNEFGVKMFDFTVIDGSVAIINVVKPLDKWILKKILQKDFQLIISCLFAKSTDLSNKQTPTKLSTRNFILKIFEHGEIVAVNLHNRVSYFLTPFKDPE